MGKVWNISLKIKFHQPLTIGFTTVISNGRNDYGNFFFVKSLRKEENKHKHEHTMNKIKTADNASISNTEVKSTEIGLKETESNRVLIADDNG